MALIRCSECGKDVSSLAAACPHCGNPVAESAAAKASGTAVVTTQQTARKFKMHMAIGVALCAIGVVFMVSESGKAHGLIAFVIGLLWYLVARVRAWWSNG